MRNTRALSQCGPFALDLRLEMLVSVGLLYMVCVYMYLYTLWLFNIAMENGPFIDGLPGFTY